MFSRWRPAALGRGMRATAFSMQATEVSAGTTVPLRQVPSLPIVGSLPYLPIKASETASSTFKLWRLLGQQHGPFFRMTFPAAGVIHVLEDPHEMSKVLQAEGRHPNGIIQLQWPVYRAARESLGWTIGGTAGTDNGLWGQGDHWRRLRTFMQTDMLAPAAARGYAAGIVTAAELASRGAEEAGGELNRFAARATFDMFHAVMFGQMTQLADAKSGQAAEENLISYTETMQVFELLNPLTSFSFFQMVMGKYLGATTPMYSQFKKHLATVDAINSAKIDRFIACADAGTLTELERNSYLARAIPRQQRSEGQPGAVSLQELRQLCSVALLAAVDTTAAIVNWCLLHIALNPEAQAALAAEVAREGVDPSKLGDRSAYPYLHALIREQHRLTPAAPVTLLKRNMEAPVTIHGHSFPRGTTFLLNGYWPGLDPERVPDPDAFKPERWLPEAEAARTGTSSALLDHTLYRGPFSAGARRCPGSRVAASEAHALLLALVRDWRIEPEDKALTWQQVPYYQGTMVQPTMPKLRFTPRVVA